MASQAPIASRWDQPGSTELVSWPSVVFIDLSLLRTGGSEPWAHWCLTSESASLILMNACRVTPSLRAS